MPRILLALALSLAATTAHAGLVTLTFDNLTTNDALEHFIGPTYSVDGLTLTATDNDPLTPPDFAFFGTQATQFDGSTALFHHISDGEIALTRSGGGSFDLLSMDVAEVPNLDVNGQPVPTTFSIAFTGTRADGSTITESFNGQGFPTISTVLFPEFTDVVSVDWFQGPGGPGTGTHQFDNIVVQAPSVVPEPPTFVLFAFGLFTAILIQTRRSGYCQRSYPTSCSMPSSS